MITRTFLSRSAGVAVLAASALLLASPSAADTPNAAAAAGGKVNINQASVEQISYLPRIGTKVAARVVEYRKTHGQFARPEDLMEVKGIGEKLFLTLKPYVAVSGAILLAHRRTLDVLAVHDPEKRRPRS